MGYTRTISRYDNGCSHHPDCFSCPFTDCLHDRPPLEVLVEVNRVRDLGLLGGVSTRRLPKALPLWEPPECWPAMRG